MRVLDPVAGHDNVAAAEARATVSSILARVLRVFALSLVVALAKVAGDAPPECDPNIRWGLMNRQTSTS